MIDEAAEIEARDEARWLENDAHGVEDCPMCAERPLGSPVDQGCPMCAGAGVVPGNRDGVPYAQFDLACPETGRTLAVDWTWIDACGESPRLLSSGGSGESRPRMKPERKEEKMTTQPFPQMNYACVFVDMKEDAIAAKVQENHNSGYVLHQTWSIGTKKIGMLFVSAVSAPGHAVAPAAPPEQAQAAPPAQAEQAPPANAAAAAAPEVADGANIQYESENPMPAEAQAVLAGQAQAAPPAQAQAAPPAERPANADQWVAKFDRLVAGGVAANGAQIQPVGPDVAYRQLVAEVTPMMPGHDQAAAENYLNRCGLTVNGKTV